MFRDAMELLGALAIMAVIIAALEDSLAAGAAIAGGEGAIVGALLLAAHFTR